MAVAFVDAVAVELQKRHASFVQVLAQKGASARGLLASPVAEVNDAVGVCRVEQAVDECELAFVGAVHCVADELFGERAEGIGVSEVAHCAKGHVDGDDLMGRAVVEGGFQALLVVRHEVHPKDFVTLKPRCALDVVHHEAQKIA